MKICVAKEPLLHAVTAISSIVPAKSTMPVLYNILLEAEEGPEGLFKLSATDLDVSLCYRMKATIDKPGAFTVQAKKLGEIIRELPADSPITLEQSGQRVMIICEKIKMVLPGLPKSEFPEFPKKSFENAIRVPRALMSKLAVRSSYAANREDDRQILRGVLWEIGQDEMSMVSTNGHRLAKMTVKESVGVEQSMSVVVPPKALDLVDKLCGEESTLEVVIDSNHLAIREENVVIFSRLIEGVYPNYEQVIPFYNSKVAIVDCMKLTEALRLMLTVANTITHRVRLFFKDNMLKLSVSTEEVGEGQKEMDVEYQDEEELEMFFNGHYMIEVLKNIESEQVKLCMQNSEAGILIVPAGESENESYIGVIMPLKVAD